MSQAAFARILNVSPRTVQAWEADARQPSDAALKLLSVAQKYPEVLFDQDLSRTATKALLSNQVWRNPTTE